ncbi:quinolinate synthase NadA [Promethearchaeum syntrophicum]|uniref:Quinolinate synthase n=1 Tax=Promethearchaeum syntrophicum TaxID=2594042 RepID=A0A5B9DDF0_9ARCH|nr:quinolinate synthase NadA [Candidatus Prometheoarchaeum syntrophicum]QEE17268.1 Quinolinate synthase A [Candidatus Prometheoarchaeum syntrophicum]
MDISEKISALKTEKGVTILAHYYTPLGVHKIADRIGDSLGLSKIAKNEVDTDYILFAGVLFMAETASVLNPAKTILSPDKSAGCPLANFLSGDDIEKYKIQYPDIPVVVYVNTTAETKAHTDICCTSSNAIKISQKIAEEHNTDTILFGPDKNLASYVRDRTDLKVISIPGLGNCPRHNLFTKMDVVNAKNTHPNAILLVHPEAPPEVQQMADYIGSTSGMLNYVHEHENDAGYIIGTEIGLMDHLIWKNPSKKFFPLNPKSLCENMKKITLEKIYTTLKSIGTPEEEQFQVKVPSHIAQKALLSIEKMIDYS